MQIVARYRCRNHDPPRFLSPSSFRFPSRAMVASFPLFTSPNSCAAGAPFSFSSSSSFCVSSSSRMMRSDGVLSGKMASIIRSGGMQATAEITSAIHRLSNCRDSFNPPCGSTPRRLSKYAPRNVPTCPPIVKAPAMQANIVDSSPLGQRWLMRIWLGSMMSSPNMAPRASRTKQKTSSRSPSLMFHREKMSSLTNLTVIVLPIPIR
mmetsp:Transcript_19705/g.37973  ORF Transcript_19705/g.37973 Transcript_19705/m.37973 type:complete len:207 (+) Transcript_19705:152-772(+)